MIGAKLSSIAASAILLLGGGAIAMAESGGPEALPEDALQARSEVDTLELDNETATRAVEEGGLGEEGSEDGEGAGTAFSEWVQSLTSEGCERGLTIAYVARTIGPTDFDGTVDEAALAEHLSNHPAIQAGCADENVTGASEGNRPPDAGSQGRGRARDVRGADPENGEAADDDPGPPAHAGPPAGSGAPDHAGPPNGR